MAAGEGDGLVGHGAILQAVSDLRADLRRSETSREQTEKRLFELIDELKDAQNDLQSTIARQEGERAGEDRARAEAARHSPKFEPAPAPPPKSAHWQRLGMWAAIAAALIGILGGMGQAVHFVVTVGSAIYQSGKPPGH